MLSVGKFMPSLFSSHAAACIQYSVAAWNTRVDLFSHELFSNMAPKLKTRMRPTKNTTIPKKRNRAQPLPDLTSSEDESGQQLQDLMDAFAAIATCVFFFYRVTIIPDS